jgi:oxygen-independent coproporphyrinogen-3 oxidase
MTGPGFGLYVHWPFCRAKCPYCDFNSHVAGAVDHPRWARALVRELDHFADLAERRPLTSVFFGGGTPSLMAPSTVAAVLAQAERRLGFDPEIEITLEANPTSVEAGKLEGFRAAGINRVSLGVQALDDAALRFLGREHTAREALAAVDLAAGLFDRFSFDLIAARPGQTVDSWEAELGRALDHAGGHLSIYQLTIETGTRFGVLFEQGALQLPPDELQADLFEITQTVLTVAGLPAYEISNHARPGEEARHNLTYWRSGDWLAIGPGAHGRLGQGPERIGTSTARMPRAWLERVERDGHAEEPREPLSRRDQLTELLMMGLRLAEGIPIARLETVGGAPLAHLLDPAALGALETEGLLACRNGRLVATPAGRQRLDAVLHTLLGRPI